MARPSKNTDKLLIHAGRELLPKVGFKGLTTRVVAKRAKVNLGMFAYYFKDKDSFIRAVLQSAYEEMFSGLSFESQNHPSAIENLRHTLKYIVKFMLSNGELFSLILVEALGGNKIVGDFLIKNFPRHFKILFSLIEKSQREKSLPSGPTIQLLFQLMPTIVAPIVFGFAIKRTPFTKFIPQLFLDNLHSENAINERIDLIITLLNQRSTSK